MITPDVRRRIERLERRANESRETLKAYFIGGRWRADRSAPATYDDVTSADREGDVVRTGGYTYTLVNDSGTMKWDRQSWNVSW